MNNRDEVIKQCTIAIQYNSREIHGPFDQWVGATTPEEERYWERKLRDALVTQALGHDRGAHDGSTGAGRNKAAKAAVEAWDAPENLGSKSGGLIETVTITLAGITEDVPADVAREAGYESGGRWSPYWHKRVLAALASCTTIREACLRAISSHLESCTIEEHARKTADAELHAARVRRQAAQLECRARGVSDKLPD